MADLEALLELAARPPREALDLAAVERRAGVLRRRRQAAVALGAACAVGLVAAVPALLGAVTGGRAERLTPLPADRPTSAPSAPVQQPVRTGRAGGPVALAPGVPAPTVAATPAADLVRPTAVVPVRTATATPGTAPAQYPAAASCEVDTVGLAPGGSRSCRFRATAAGGWRYRFRGGLGTGPGAMATYTVLVTRDGVTSRNPGDTGADCANDVIRAGDLVEVIVRQESQGYIERWVGAGSGFRCGTR